MIILNLNEDSFTVHLRAHLCSPACIPYPFSHCTKYRHYVSQMFSLNHIFFCPSHCTKYSHCVIVNYHNYDIKFFFPCQLFTWGTSQGLKTCHNLAIQTIKNLLEHCFKHTIKLVVVINFFAI